MIQGVHRSDVELIEAMDESTSMMTRASSALLGAIAEFDDRSLWELHGTSMTQWLAARYSLVYATASEWLRVARALKSLPAIAAAYANGKLSWDQLRPLTKFATPETDERWAREAPSWTCAGLWQEWRRLEEIQREDAQEIQRGRYLSFDWNEPKTELYFQGRVGAEQGAALEQAVMQRSEQIVIADDPYDPAGARQVDALVELATEGKAGEGSAPTLVVHADAHVLPGGDHDGSRLAETGDGARLSSDAVRRLACDASIEWVLESDGRPVGIGRRGRAVPGSMARLLRHRDPTCRFPGCERRKWLKAHHIKHWGSGGRTDLDNLVLLCHAHHRAIHEGGWSIRGDPARTLRFHDPTGRPLLTSAESHAA